MGVAPHLPTLIERAEVPSYFPLFRSAASLAYLAHKRKGPAYIIVGGKAWYDIADIKAWIEENKVRSPTSSREANHHVPTPGGKKRGRPTKREQYYRRCRENADD